MKLGAENSKKTAFAVGLFVVAVFLLIRMLGGSGSSSAAAPAAPATSTAAASTTTTAARPAKRAAIRRGPGRSTAKSSSSDTQAAPNLDPRLKLDLLKSTEALEYSGTGRNIFAMQAEDVKIEKPVAPPFVHKGSQPPVTPAVVTPPPPPPIPLKFFGFANQSGSPKKVFLSSTDGGDIFMAQEGDVVQRRYKIVKINNNNIEVQDVLNNNRQTIPLSAS